MLSGVVLAGANLDQPDGGILTAEAIAGLPLWQLELAVLSACESGLGEMVGGEGVFGLQRAFHVASTRTVIATLWIVHESTTLVPADDARLTQDPDVMGDVDQRRAKPLGYLGHVAFTVTQKTDNA